MRRFISEVRSPWYWLTPLFILCLLLSPFLAFTTSGALQQAGLPLFLIGIIGLLLSREGRLKLYALVPKTPTQQEKFRIATEMERQKKMLIQAGVPRRISWMYQDYFIHYPNWIHQREKYYVPTMVQDARQKADNTIGIQIEEDHYYFKFIQYGYKTVEGERDVEGQLELFTDRAKLLTLRLIPVYRRYPGGKYERRWRPIAIEYGTWGDWVKNFERLEKRILSEIAERKREERFE